MAFAMKRGGSRVSLTFFFFNFFKPFRIIPRLPKCVLHTVWAFYYIHIVVEVTMNMAEYTTVVVVGSQRPEQPKNVNI